MLHTLVGTEGKSWFDSNERGENTLGKVLGQLRKVY